MTPIQHSKFPKFFRVNENKTRLFELTADCAVEQCTEPVVVARKDEKVVSNRGTRSTGFTTLLSQRGKNKNSSLSPVCRSIWVQESYDVAVISLYVLLDLGIEKLRIEFGQAPTLATSIYLCWCSGWRGMSSISVLVWSYQMWHSFVVCRKGEEDSVRNCDC